jgi:Fic family protein
LKTPEFIEGADSVKVIFYFLPDILAKDADEDNLLKLFKMREEVNISEVMQYLNISRNTATRKLNKMVESGKLVRVGKGPAVRYLLSR